MRFLVMFVTAVCVLFLIKLKTYSRFQSVYNESTEIRHLEEMTAGVLAKSRLFFESEHLTGN